MPRSFRSRAFAPVALVALLTLPACARGDVPRPPVRSEEAAVWSVTTEGGRVELAVEIADDPEERARGLMGRRRLPEDAGMVFLFEAPSTNTFWMKDTSIPLSIAFWDADGAIVGIVDMQPCEADPCPSYASPEPFVGAVEANIGWFDEHGVRVGDRVALERS